MILQWAESSSTKQHAHSPHSTHINPALRVMSTKSGDCNLLSGRSLPPQPCWAPTHTRTTQAPLGLRSLPPTTTWYWDADYSIRSSRTEHKLAALQGAVLWRAGLSVISTTKCWIEQCHNSEMKTIKENRCWLLFFIPFLSLPRTNSTRSVSG